MAAEKPTSTRKLVRATQRLLAEALKDLTDAVAEAEDESMAGYLAARSLLKHARLQVGGMGRNIEGAIEELDRYIDAPATEG